MFSQKNIFAYLLAYLAKYNYFCNSFAADYFGGCNMLGIVYLITFFY